jgi:maltose alpha-D-glucosyltransferase/alpha-amylase
MIPVESLAQPFSPTVKAQLSRLLPGALRSRPWFLGKARTIRTAYLDEVVRLPDTTSYIVTAIVEYTDADAETYMVPVMVSTGDDAQAVMRDRSESVMARLDGPPGETAILHGALFDRRFADGLLRAVVRRRRFKGEYGDIVGAHARGFRKAWGMARSTLEPRSKLSDHAYSIITFGEDFVLKLYRKLESGPHPDREVIEFLTEYTEFKNIPRALGSLEYRRQINEEQEERTTIGLLLSYTRNATNAWHYTLDHLGLYFERALAIHKEDRRIVDLVIDDPLTLASQPVPQIVGELLGGHVEVIRRLGQRTGELHQALSSRDDLPDFAPEPFTDFYRHGLYHGMLGQVNRAFEALRNRVRTLTSPAQEEARALLDREPDIRANLQPLRDERVFATRIRHHGDYHLGNILFTGKDVVITNFEGDCTRPISERRIKRSPLRDVAGMLRSFHYVAHAVLFGHVPGIIPRHDGQTELEHWAHIWYSWVGAIFLAGYLEASQNGAFLPRSQRETSTMLRAYMIEKSAFEIMHELEQRPDWIRIAVRGLYEQLTDRGLKTA